MRTFLKQPTTVQPTTLAKSTGNQAQLLHSNAEERDAVSTDTALSAGFGHDFAWIPVNPSPPLAPSHPVAQCFASGGQSPQLRGPTAPTVDLPSLMSASGHQALDHGTRESMESGFRRDLGHVRIHNDRAAGDAAAALSAEAFTTGQDIYFAQHRYQPRTAVGRHLIAHEVAHTIQQSSGSAPADTDSLRGTSLSVGAPGDRLESEADRAADAVLAGLSAAVDAHSGAAGLVQRKPTSSKPAPPSERQASISITVEKRMTPHEFAVRAFMQAYRMPGDLAEQRVSAIEATGRSAGTGPNFEHGVRSDEVGKPLQLNYPLPTLSEGEKADVAGRAKQLAALPPEQRSAVDEETDRRFWQQTGAGKGTKLSATSHGDAPNRSLWMRTRDEVVHDNNKIALLPARTKSLLLPGDRRPTPEQYATVLRIADKLDKFSEDDWALYQRRINASTSDFATFEASVDRFRGRQKIEGALNSRIQGMTALYQAYRTARDAPKPFMGVGGGVSSGQIQGYDERYRKAQDDYVAALKANGFKDAVEFEDTVAQWRQLFRARAVELTLLALKASEQVVGAELARYRDPAEVSALHAQTATMRRLDTAATSADIRTLPTMTQVYASGQGPKTPGQLAAAEEAKEKHAAAQAERDKLAETHPILKDARLHTYRLNTGDASEFGSRLRDDATDRLADITKTRHRVLTDPDAIYQFDRIRELALQELGAAGPGAVGRLIVEDQLKAIADDDFLRGLAIAALAIGLGVLTFGTGTIAVLGAAGALSLSVYSASEEWDKYDKASAAAHTAFDAEKAVSSQDPTILWLAISLIGIGLDGAALVKALKAAAPAAKVLAETGSAAKFEETLAKATELSEGVQKALNKQAKAEEAFTKAAEDLSNYARLKMYSGVDPVYLGKVTKAAYYAAAEGIRDFQVFLAKLKLQKFTKAVDLEKLTAVELEALEGAFKAGVKDFESAVPAFTVEVRFASGTKNVTFGSKGELLLEGEALSAEGARHGEVFKQLGLTHAYAGHGAGRDALTIANEAIQNAAKPKGAGMSSMFASDEAMLRSLEAARVEVAAGRGVPSGARRLVQIPTTPSTGRVFVAKSKLPAGVTPLNETPFAALPDVAELPVTRVTALFTQTGPGTFEIFDIFPGFAP